MKLNPDFANIFRDINEESKLFVCRLIPAKSPLDSGDYTYLNDLKWFIKENLYR